VRGVPARVTRDYRERATEERRKTKLSTTRTFRSGAERRAPVSRRNKTIQTNVFQTFVGHGPLVASKQKLRTQQGTQQ